MNLQLTILSILYQLNQNTDIKSKTTINTINSDTTYKHTTRTINSDTCYQYSTSTITNTLPIPYQYNHHQYNQCHHQFDFATITKHQRTRFTADSVDIELNQSPILPIPPRNDQYHTITNIITTNTLPLLSVPSIFVNFSPQCHQHSNMAKSSSPPLD